MAATAKQIAYIESLAREAKVPVPTVTTFEEASATIEDLLRQCPIREGTGRAIHALLKDGHMTRDDLKLAVGVESFSPTKGCSEHDGQRALRILKGYETEVRRQPQPASFVDGLAEVQRRQRAQPPRRLKANPFDREEPAEAPAPAPQPRVVLCDPGHHRAMAMIRLGINTMTASPETIACFDDDGNQIAPLPHGVPLVRSVLEHFPGAELVGVSNPER